QHRADRNRRGGRRRHEYPRRRGRGLARRARRPPDRDNRQRLQPARHIDDLPADRLRRADLDRRRGRPAPTAASLAEYRHEGLLRAAATVESRRYRPNKATRTTTLPEPHPTLEHARTVLRSHLVQRLN